MGHNYLFTFVGAKGLLRVVLAYFFVLMGFQSAQATDYYFSNNGNDGNSGTSQSSPWKSVSKLQSTINSAGSGDRILLEKGSVWYEVALIIDGKSGITLSAYGTGNKPVLSGGRLLSGFNNSGNVYSINISSSFPRGPIRVPTGVVINGKWQDIARSQEYFTLGSNSSTQLQDNSRNWTQNDLVGSIAIIQPVFWTWCATPITANTSNTLTFLKTQNGSSSSNYLAYYIANHDSYLTSPGDWTFKNNLLKVYYNSNLNNQKVQFAMSDSIIGGQNTSNITISGITFELANYNLVSFKNSSNITIDDCEFRFTAGTACKFNNISNLNFNNSYVHHAGAMGLYTLQCNNPIIRHNLFKHISTVNIGLSNYTFRLGAAISNATPSGTNSYIEYNYFDSVGLAIQSHTFLPGRTCSYSYNFIENYGISVSDCAAIYAASDYDATAKTVKNNIIKDALTGGKRYFPYGNNNLNPHPALHPHALYVDEAGFGYKCDSNSIENTSFAFYTNRSHSNRFNYCNVVSADLHNSNTYNAVYLKDQAIGPSSFSADRDEVKYNNIVLGTNPGTRVYLRHTSEYVSSAPDANNFYFDNNKIANPFNSTTNIGKYVYNWGAVQNEYTLTQMQNNSDNVSSNSTDASTVVNPQGIMYSQVSGQVSQSEFVKFFTNFSKTTRTVNLGTAVFKDINGVSISGKTTVPPFYSKILFYVSGDITTVDPENYIDATLVPALSWADDGLPPVAENHAPVLLNSEFMVEESLSLPLVIGTLSFSETDANQSLSFNILSGNDQGIFAVNNSGQLLFNSEEINFEGNPEYNLTIKVTDNGTPALSAQAQVRVRLVENGVVENHAPAIAPQAFEVYYNMALPVNLGTVIATDSDIDQHLTYSIVSGNEEGIFAITAQVGELYLTEYPASNSPETYNLLVKVTDDAGTALSAEAMMTVKLNAQELTFFIDPENEEDTEADGSFEHPFSGWSKVEWVENGVYLQKRGTRANEDKILVTANNITIGDYGTGEKPVINSSATEYALKVTEKHDVIIRNMDIIAEEAIGCIYFMGATCENNVIENCNLKGADYGLRIIDGKSYTVKYNVFANDVDGIYSIADFAEIYYNVFKGNHKAVNLSSYSSSAQIYNNVFYDNRQGISTSYAEVSLYNNIFYLTQAGDQAINHKLDKLVSNNNMFYPEQSGFIEIEEKRYEKLADYQSEYGLDLSSFASDPQFVDIYNNNFSVELGSTAIDAGKIVGLTEDFLGQPVPYGGAPDIGSVEVSGTTDIIISKQTDAEGEVSVFPNPSNGEFNLSFLNSAAGISAELIVRAISGLEVYREKVDLNGLFTSKINLSDTPPGVYFLSIKAGEKLITQKLIKK